MIKTYQIKAYLRYIKDGFLTIRPNVEVIITTEQEIYNTEAASILKILYWYPILEIHNLEIKILE